ncbi:MAG: RDD family protein [uncultured Aureispira sp.]|uniref:RDD family protein n=1 Tax=uncultured Aureispira sp. TaxID=1331704 RepID=A0A6S6T8B7_9BACT|nr:MAG: RDD family protein [uncultured Aureispira sp.]
MSSELLDDLDYLDKKAPKPVYVGFWKRFVATGIDVVGLSVLLVCWTSVTELLGFILPSGANYFLQDVVTPVLLLLYFPLCESSRYQASVGKYILGMKIIDENGEKMTFWRALARVLSKMLSYSFASIGFIMIAFTDKKRGLHDMIASTYVVER